MDFLTAFVTRTHTHRNTSKHLKGVDTVPRNWQIAKLIVMSHQYAFP